jgi:hypothetical protein
VATATGLIEGTDMTVTPAFLTRGAAVAAVAAGLLFIGVQIGHPHLDASSITSTEVQIRGFLKFLMAILALVGITGMYLSQVRRNGVLGLIGYSVLASGYILIACMTYLAAFVLPQLATTDAAYVDDIIDVVVGRATTGDVGFFTMAVQVQNYSFLAGGLILGIALYRARVLARWATALLAVGGVVTILLSVLPDAFYRLLAFPNGIAMVGLGVSLWLTSRGTREPASELVGAE